MIQDFIEVMRRAGHELTARELEEILWLAPFLEPRAAPEKSTLRDESHPGLSSPEASTSREETSKDGDGRNNEEEEAPPAPDKASEVEHTRSPSEESAGGPETDAVIPSSEGSRTGGALIEFRSPAAPALPHSLAISRALRPLKRRISSTRRFELDDAATVTQIAEGGPWVPVLRPIRERWLEVVLVIDSCRSMSLWTDLLVELRTLLRHHGAFRDVRTWSLVTEAEDGELRLYQGARPRSGAPARSWRELVDPSGRRLTLVVSDCVSSGWHSGAVGHWLREWGIRGPVAILQMLPQRTWVRTALRRSPTVWLQASGAGVPGTRLGFGTTPGVRLEQSRRGPSWRSVVDVGVPVLTLESGAVTDWAQLVAGATDAWVPGVLLRKGAERPRAQEQDERGEPVSLGPLERVEHFDSTASTTARKLARLLAAAPLSLRIMQLVREALLPEAEQVHLAEVFLGGLLEERGDAKSGSDPDEIRYNFAPGVRQALLESAQLSASVDVLSHVWMYIHHRMGQSLDFSALLRNPASANAEALCAAHQSFARVTAAVLRQLGGPFAKLANQLETVLARREPPETVIGKHASRDEPRQVETPEAAETTVATKFPYMRRADVVLLTALSLEYQAVLQVDAGAWTGSQWEQEVGPHGFPVAFRTFQDKAGRPLRIAVTQAGGMGAVAATNALLSLVDAYQPQCVAMSGVCSGHPGKTHPGDVIVAERLFFHDTGKRLPNGRVQQDIKTYNLRVDWKGALEHFDFAAHFRDEEWWKQRPLPYKWQENWVLAKLREGVADPSSLPECQEFCPQWDEVLASLWRSGHVKPSTLILTGEGRKRIELLLIQHNGQFPDAATLFPFKVHIAPMRSGSQVVEDEDIWGFISEQMRNTLGLDMEAAAIGALAHAHRERKLDALVMKGVMDFANHGRNEHFKEFAARASAECLVAFIREHLDVEVLPGMDDLLLPEFEKLPENPPPSALLNARYEVVPFHEQGREAILTELWRWCYEGPSIAVRLLHAEGGAGKTRLAIEWIRRLSRQWAAGFLPKDVPDNWFERVWALGRPVLVVIDYAEIRSDLRETLLRVHRYAQQAGTVEQRRMRILLLARNAGDWWQSLRQSDTGIGTWLDLTPPYELQPLAMKMADREKVFHEAAKRFAAVRNAAYVARAPGPLTAAHFGRVLYLHMAALAAVEGLAFESNTLMEVILDHEERFWDLRVRQSSVMLSRQRSLARQMVAAATLRGGLPDASTASTVAERILGAPLYEDARALLQLLQWMYQRTSGERAMFLPALEPDLLGEGMVLRVAAPELQGERLPSDWIERVIPLGEESNVVSTALEVLGRASAVQPDVVRPWLERLLDGPLSQRALLALEAAKTIGLRTGSSMLGDILADRLERDGTVELAHQLEAAGIPAPMASLHRVAKWTSRTLPLRVGIQEGLFSQPITLEPGELTRHSAFLGGSGSGKTTVALNVVEQLLLRGIPAILVDRKGDLAAYAREEVWLKELEDGPLDERRRLLRERVDVALYTPGRSDGRPLAIPVIPRGLETLPPEERDQGVQQAADAIAGMLEYKSNPRDKAARALLGQALRLLVQRPLGMDVTLEVVQQFVQSGDPALVHEADGLDPKSFSKLVQDLAMLRLNTRVLLSTSGERLDLEELLGRGPSGVPGRTRLSIISTKFLGGTPSVLFWVSQLLLETNRWASQHPSPGLQAVLLFDEADLYLPAQSQPATKQPMENLLKRARSAGVGVMLATQSPGDLDYKCRENVRTWFVGRVKEDTALKKLKPMFTDARGGDATSRLAGQKMGQFHIQRDGQVQQLKADRNVILTEQLAEDEILRLARRTLELSTVTPPPR